MSKFLEPREADINHIYGNLWMGGCMGLPAQTLPTHIDYLISLHVTEKFLVDHELKAHYNHELVDDHQTPVDLNVIYRLARLTNEYCRSGTTLVHCQGGFNRSGLVVGAALMLNGMTADDAIQLIRSKRGQWALFNQVFERFLRNDFTEWIKNNANQGKQDGVSGHPAKES